MVNWIKQMVPQPVMLPPGAVPIERSKKSSRSSLDKSTYTQLWMHSKGHLSHTTIVTLKSMNPTCCDFRGHILGSVWWLFFSFTLKCVHVFVSSYVSTTGIPQWNLSGHWQQGLRVRFEPSQSLKGQWVHLSKDLKMRRTALHDITGPQYWSWIINSWRPNGSLKKVLIL